MLCLELTYFLNMLLVCYQFARQLLLCLYLPVPLPPHPLMLFFVSNCPLCLRMLLKLINLVHVDELRDQVLS